VEVRGSSLGLLLVRCDPDAGPLLPLARSVTESSLLDQLSLLSNPTPVDLDPEEAYSSLSSSKQTKSRQAEDEDDDDMAEDEAAGRGHYVEVGCVPLSKLSASSSSQ
jgi:hypothetical protein